jgi:RNA polymerase sigma-70 factor (ECF subfamily)
MTASTSVTVADLLVRARAGDRSALGHLFGLCRNYVGLIARTQIGAGLRAKVDASDLVQQTLLEAYRGFARFQGTTEAEWLAWLRRIVTHNAADFIRHYRGTDKRGGRREVSLHTGEGDASFPEIVDPVAPGESPSQYLLRKERELQIADALAGLSPDHQEVIALRNLERLSFDEVAARMGRSRPAVQMLWMRAVHKLKEALESSFSESQS